MVSARGGNTIGGYKYLADWEKSPEIRVLVPPYSPADLLDQKLSGEVVVDAQITEEGKVGGIWLVSAVPDIFGNLATASIRQWQFDPIPVKIRIVLQFRP